MSNSICTIEIYETPNGVEAVADFGATKIFGYGWELRDVLQDLDKNLVSWAVNHLASLGGDDGAA